MKERKIRDETAACLFVLVTCYLYKKERKKIKTLPKKILLFLIEKDVLNFNPNCLYYTKGISLNVYICFYFCFPSHSFIHSFLDIIMQKKCWVPQLFTYWKEVFFFIFIFVRFPIVGSFFCHYKDINKKKASCKFIQKYIYVSFYVLIWEKKAIAFESYIM